MSRCSSRPTLDICLQFTPLFVHTNTQALRAMTTLMQYAGEERVKIASEYASKRIQEKLRTIKSLVNLAEDGKAEELLVELRNFADPNSKRDDGMSALMAAVKHNQTEVIKHLLDFKATVSPKLLEEPSILKEIAESEDAPMTKLIVSTGAEPSMKVMKVAMKHERLTLLKLFLAHTSKPNFEIIDHVVDTNNPKIIYEVAKSDIFPRKGLHEKAINFISKARQQSAVSILQVLFEEHYPVHCNALLQLVVGQPFDHEASAKLLDLLIENKADVHSCNEVAQHSFSIFLVVKMSCLFIMV